MNEDKNYITPDGHSKLVNELEQLLKIERPEVVKVVSWAAGNGDRSENADYIYGKKRLREIDKRIRFLNKRLSNVIVIDPENQKIHGSRIQFGATIVIELENGEQKTISIVGEDESNPGKRKTSWASPLGRALLGKTVGDSGMFKSPQGIMEFEVLEVFYNKIQK